MNGVVSSLMRALSRLGGMWLSPRRTLRALAAGQGGGPVEALALYAAVQVCVASRLLYKSLMLAGEAPDIARRRATDALWSLSRNDLALLAVVAVSLVSLGLLLNARARRRGRVPRLSARGLAAAAAYLALPLVLLKAIGAVTMWLGADQWWLPHHPVDSYVVVVKQQVDWGRFWLKCAVAYGPSALLLADLVVALVRDRVQDAPLDEGFLRPALGLTSLCLVVFVGFGAVADVASERATLRPTLPGDRLPSMPLPWLRSPEGEAARRFDAADYSGKVLVLDFWASWCAPCRRSMPELDALQKELADEGLVVVGVNREPRDRPAALAALEELGVSFPSAVDSRGFGERLGLTSLPTSYVVDRKGVLRHLHLGYTDVARIRVEVEALLDEPVRTAEERQARAVNVSGARRHGPGPPRMAPEGAAPMWTRYIAQNPDTPARTIEGEAIVITPHDSTLHTLNETATFIWDRADGTRTLADIAEEMLGEFEVDESTLKADALAFVEEAVAKGLMQASDEPAKGAP